MGDPVDKQRENNGGKMLGGSTGKGFMPGQSGNPKGRPRKCPLTERFEDFIEGSELVTIGKDGKAQRTRLPDGLTVADMIVLAWAKKAMLGDARARKDALERLEGKVPDVLQMGDAGASKDKAKFDEEADLIYGSGDEAVPGDGEGAGVPEGPDR